MKPVPGAVLVSTNDPFLYQDIQSHLPEASKILIPNDSPYYELGLDGGAWIDYATDRRTVKMSYTADLTSAEVFQEICSEGVQYIYLGDKPQSFSMVQIQQRKDWYSPLMDYPDAKLYQVMHCPVQ